jgi:predicted permease
MRQRETAIRMALGASRTRLGLAAMRGALFLGLAGAAGGLLVARLRAPLLIWLLPPTLMRLPISLVPSLKIDGLAVGLALTVSLIFSVIPALSPSRVSPQDSLRRGTATTRTGLLGRLMLILQTAASLVLLVGTGLLIRTFYTLAHTNPGFDVEHLITFTINPAMDEGAGKLDPVFPGELQRSIAALPGVRIASLAGVALMQRIGLKTSVAPSGQKIPPQAFLNSSENFVSSTFFETLGIPIVSGHNFSDADAARAPVAPIVINQAFARLIFPNENPLGKSIGMGAPGQVAKASGLVVGIAGDSKYRSLREAMLPFFYRPRAPQSTQDGPFYLYVQTQGAPSDIINSARKVLSSLAPQLAFSEVQTMQEQLSQSLWQERILAVLAGAFSAIAMLICGMGLYSLLAYDANLRTREFGIRSAVGAQKLDLALLLLREPIRILAPGLAIGVVSCLLLTRVIASVLYGTKPLDPASFEILFQALD